MSIRSLTGFPREKVKVLMVMYDGGKHAEEVSQFTVFPLFLTQSSQCSVEPQQLCWHSRSARSRSKLPREKRPDPSCLSHYAIPRLCYTLLCNATHYG